MLNVLTPVSRPQLLSRIYTSLPPYPDVRWWLAVSKGSVSALDLPADERIVVVEVDSPCENIADKRNALFANMASGYFCLLDDDTRFRMEMYTLYQSCVASGYVGAVIGRQTLGRFCQRLPLLPTPDYPTNILDTGMLLAHHSLLESGIRWEAKKNTYSDRLFYTRLAEVGYPVKLVQELISDYNFYSYKVKLLRKGEKQPYYIHNSILTLIYLAVNRLRHKGQNTHYNYLALFVINHFHGKS